MDLLTVVGVFSCFFHSTATAEAISQVFQAKTTEREDLLDCNVTKVVHEVCETGSKHNVMSNCKKKWS